MTPCIVKQLASLIPYKYFFPMFGKKITIILQILVLSGIFQSILLIVPHSAFAASISINGKAKVLNTEGFLDFDGYESNVTVESTTGNFSGYVFSEDMGWIAFGTTDNPQGPVTVDLNTGVVTGRARVLNTGAQIDFGANNSNVTISGATFSGYVFSEDLGWIDFGDTGVSAVTAIVQNPSPTPTPANSPTPTPTSTPTPSPAVIIREGVHFGPGSSIISR